MTPPEGFAQENEGTARRGRRDPELQHMMDAEDLVEDHENQDMTEYALVSGDIILAKVTLAGPTELGDGWYTYGVQSRVQDGESEVQAFERIAAITNNRVIDLATDAYERVSDLVEAQRQATRQRRIPTTRG